MTLIYRASRAHTKRGQSSFEFVMLASAMLMAVALLIIVAQGVLLQVKEDRQQAVVRSIEVAVLAELTQAQKAPPGYQRYFTLPSSFEGQPYKISVLEEPLPLADSLSDALVISWQGTIRLRFISQNTTGTLGPGRNLIQRNVSGINVTNFP